MKFVCLTVLLVIGPIGHAFSQESVPFTQTQQQLGMLESELEKLNQLTEQMSEQNRAGLPSTTDQMFVPEKSSAKLSPAFPNGPGDNLDEIKSRIRLLKRLRLSNELPEGPLKTAPSVVPPIPEEVMSAIEASQESKEPPPAEDKIVEAESIQAREITGSPVDALALAQSLYRTRNYAAALKALESIDRKSIPKSDQSWVELMIGFCHRRLGDSKEADATLRALSNARDVDEAVGVARWQLKQSETIDGAKPVFENLVTEIEDLMKRAQEHATY